MPAGLPRNLAVATITIGLTMSVLANSMTNLALPYIAHDLHISAESSIWIVNASQIALMVTLLPVAALADIVGYRHVYRAGLLLFSLASLACTFAPSLNWLIAARVVQGLGGSAIMAIQPALVRSIYPRNMLGRGLGMNTTVVATSLAAGPSIGAALLSIWSWPVLFGVYVPLGFISFVLAERYLPHTTHVHRPFDVLSAGMSGITFGLLIFGIDGIAHGHSKALILGELGTAVLLGTLFIWRQTRLADPMMPIDVFRRPLFALSISSATCTFTAQGLAFVSLPFFFHTVLGKSATDTGILLTAWPLALAGIAPIAGRLADRHHAGFLGAIGLTSMTTGLILTALHLCRTQQPADDEFRAARQERQRRRHHRLGAHARPNRGLGPGGIGVRPVRLLRRRQRGCHGVTGRDLAGCGLRRDGAGGRQHAHAAPALAAL